MKRIVRLKIQLVLLFTAAFCVLSFGQSVHVLPGTLSDEIADRWDILYDFDHQIFSTQRNTSRKELTRRAYHLYSNEKIGAHDMTDLLYICNDNNEYNLATFSPTLESTEQSKKVYDEDGVFYHNENSAEEKTLLVTQQKPILKYFYKTKANFFEVNKHNFTLRANPILNLRFGNAIDDPNTIFQNTRGAEIRGTIDQKIYFYTSILENQRRFNNYIESRIDNTFAIPGNGFFKPFQSGVAESISGYDYLNAQAYVGINATKSVAIEFGHGKHFIGNGIRSLFLSDYGQNYFYLKFNTRIWKFHYQNLFTELAPISARQNPGDRVLPKKYMANHYLSYRPTKNIEVGIFEAVVFSRENHFEFQYLNPVILYRTVEQFLDSPDNALIGLNAKWNIKNRFQLYGQLILDEFKLSEIRARNGWWANKNGIQIGLKYVNVAGIDHLDAQIEYNQVRPYTYAHRDTLIDFPAASPTSYSHYNQPLAHPLGSNFNEVVLNFIYRPNSKLSIQSRLISSTYGQDPEGKNFGGNILLSTNSRESDYGNEIGQGINTKMVSANLDISYQIFHNYFIDLNLLYRKADADLDALDIDTKYIGGGIRVNLGNIKLDY